jgi:peptidyl-tRNA hydrolase
MAAHAILASFVRTDPGAQRAFLSDDSGTKVNLASPDEATLWQAYRRACDAGLPCHLWVEDGIPTALGIGPAVRVRIKPIVCKLKLYGAAAQAELNAGKPAGVITTLVYSSE